MKIHFLQAVLDDSISHYFDHVFGRGQSANVTSNYCNNINLLLSKQLSVKSQQQKHQEKVWNMFKVNNKERHQIAFLKCFYCCLETGKCFLGNYVNFHQNIVNICILYIAHACIFKVNQSVYGHVHIISYSFSFRITILYGMMLRHFSFYVHVEYKFKNFEHYFNIILVEKATI